MVNSLSTPKGDITIRLAVPADAASLLDLRLESLSRHPESFAADVAMTSAEGAGAWAERIEEYARSESAAIAIAEAGGQIIGMAGITRGHWPKTRHIGTLWGVYVKPDWRGHHICEAILEEITVWAQAQSLAVMYLGVTTSSISAIRCYGRSGFTVYGVEPKVIYHNEVYYDELLMAKLL
jgi:RimJ/RimL family protein N-acetyltransferase